eukprot:4576100-Prymnesium_polylepis.1
MFGVSAVVGLSVPFKQRGHLERCAHGPPSALRMPWAPHAQLEADSHLPRSIAHRHGHVRHIIAVRETESARVGLPVHGEHTAHACRLYTHVLHRIHLLAGHLLAGDLLPRHLLAWHLRPCPMGGWCGRRIASRSRVVRSVCCRVVPHKVRGHHAQREAHRPVGVLHEEAERAAGEALHCLLLRLAGRRPVEEEPRQTDEHPARVVRLVPLALRQVRHATPVPLAEFPKAVEHPPAGLEQPAAPVLEAL